jgi:hypothetical protein
VARYVSAHESWWLERWHTVVTVLKNEGMRLPVFRDTGASFIVTVYGRPEQRTSDAQQTALTPTQRHILSFIQSQAETSPAQLRRLLADRSPRSISVMLES